MTAQVVTLGALAIVVLGVLGLHAYLARRRSPWPGACVPLLALVGVGALTVTGRLEVGRPLVVALAGFVLLLWMWSGGRRSRSAGDTAAPLSAPDVR